jgi:hypothetical protein
MGFLDISSFKFSIDIYKEYIYSRSNFYKESNYYIIDLKWEKEEDNMIF